MNYETLIKGYTIHYKDTSGELNTYFLPTNKRPSKVEILQHLPYANIIGMEKQYQKLTIPVKDLKKHLKPL